MQSDPHSSGVSEEHDTGLVPRSRYRRLLTMSITSVMLVSVIPLILVMWIKQYSYEQALHAERMRPILRLTSNAKYTMESFLSERISAISLILQEKRFDELRDPMQLKKLLASVKHAFGGFTDLGLINEDGLQISYTGPYNLEGKSYREQAWFHEVMMRGIYVSNVFMGYRKFPHFVIANRHTLEDGTQYILRATISSEAINRMTERWIQTPSTDAFLITHDGVLQTPSRHFGKILETSRLPKLKRSEDAAIHEMFDEEGEALVLGYAYVSSSPFVVVLVNRPGAMDGGLLSLRRNLLIIILVSIALITIVVVTGSVQMIRRLREADIRRAAIFKKMAYTNRMAVIGRLAAGVAHEINNPLSIINEKAGLLSDLFLYGDSPPDKTRSLKIIDAILNSVERCSTITHRLLGFAKHMDVNYEQVSLRQLIEEVLGFLEKESHYRELKVAVDMSEDLPQLVSDRGQLQQLFLNIINNAFAAVHDGGRIAIAATVVDNNQISVRIEDNGVGIPEEHLQQIFEPFFTTKESNGTGLGLSITYGIVEKLGGHISVTSKVNEGTCFTVTLPVSRENDKDRSKWSQ